MHALDRRRRCLCAQIVYVYSCVLTIDIIRSAHQYGGEWNFAMSHYIQWYCVDFHNAIVYLRLIQLQNSSSGIGLRTVKGVSVCFTKNKRLKSESKSISILFLTKYFKIQMDSNSMQ